MDKAKLESALRNAHKAGDTAAAKQLANALKAMPIVQAPETAPQAPSVQDGDPYLHQRAEAEARQLREWQGEGAAGFGSMADGIATGIPLAKSLMAGVQTPLRMIRDGVGPVDGYQREKALLDAQQRLREEKNPIGSMAGALTGGVMAGGAAVKGVQAAGLALKPAAGLLSRTAAGAAGGGAMGAASGFDQGVSLEDRLDNAKSGALMGAALGGAIPVAGAGARAAGKKALSTIRSTVSPKAEAAARVREAMAKDAAKGRVLKADDIKSAADDGQQLFNMDRGGENTRALARSAANQSPDARGLIQGEMSDRFLTQSNRAIDKVSKIVGGNVDDVSMKEGLQKAARQQNSAAYKKAYDFNFGNNHPIELDAMLDRIPAKAMRSAMQVAKAEGRPFGQQLVASIDDAADTVQFSRKPSMREWDYIQRGLRSATDQSFRTGAGEVGTAYKGLRNEILETLDAVNPAFKQARQGAAAAFGADDALEAGKKFAATRQNTLEMKKALMAMKPAEKKLFQTGYASQIIDRLKSPSDSVDVIKQVFGSPEAREKTIMAFGKAKAKELEAFTRVEAAMKASKDAMGNSTTARQLAEIGLVGGANAGAGIYGYATGDWRYSALVAAGSAARYGGKRVNQNVIDKIGELLMSGDEKALERVINNAKMSGQYMEALRAVTDEFLKRAPLVAGSMSGSAVAN